jgi:hypothetical protein
MDQKHDPFLESTVTAAFENPKLTPSKLRELEMDQNMRAAVRVIRTMFIHKLKGRGEHNMVPWVSYGTD